jgi:hypothetical protein
MNSPLQNLTVCPLCDGPIKQPGLGPDSGLTAWVVCDRCKQFKITDSGYSELSAYRQQRYLLTALFRNWTGDEWPEIGFNSIPRLLRQAPRLGVSEQLDRLLDLLARATHKLGAFSNFNTRNDYPLLAARGQDEVEYLLDALGQMTYVWRDLATKQTTVTPSGWKRLEEAQKSGKDSRFAFVAMSFDSSLTILYDSAVEPAIRSAGYEPIRIDRQESLNTIDDEMIGQMRRARFMVADFTGQRPSVYFEAGFMRGLGRNVIWMCSKEEIDSRKVHFDVRQYPFIAWESHDDARERLYKRILANEGEGPTETQVRHSR